MGGVALFAGLAGGSAAVVSDGVLAAANNFFRVHPFLASFCICEFAASAAVGVGVGVGVVAFSCCSL